jgi:hypothetical protein
MRALLSFRMSSVLNTVSNVISTFFSMQLVLFEELQLISAMSLQLFSMLSLQSIALVAARFLDY